MIYTMEFKDPKIKRNGKILAKSRNYTGLNVLIEGLLAIELERNAEELAEAKKKLKKKGRAA